MPDPPSRFDPSAYGPTVAAILGDGQRLAALGPGQPDLSVRPLLEGFDPARGFPELRDADAGYACLAGLWLYHDFLDDSHQISQGLHTPEGSFWHALMHRREPDPGNSNYWWQRVGHHPVLDQLREQAPAAGYRYTSPAEFVAFCEKCRDNGTPDEELARRVQLLEWRLLFDWCYRKAVRV
ncbi:MAG: hypothetical protein U0871_26990 [Gemmataceae bacterium]